MTIGQVALLMTVVKADLPLHGIAVLLLARPRCWSGGDEPPDQRPVCGLCGAVVQAPMPLFSGME
jgi:hypothetical protein